MDWYLLIAVAAVLAQSLVLYSAIRNYQYVATRLSREERTWYRPRTALIIPCKGIDTRFDINLRSFFEQDYGNYHLLLVVEDESDLAYRELQRLKEQSGIRNGRASAHSAIPDPKSQIPPCGPLDVRILVAGRSRSCSQKIHNLLYALEQVPADTEVLAFADSDICVPPGWLGHLVHPLYRPKRGATTGYRWFVPTTHNLPTLALSAINASIAQFLGNSPFNLAWGGSMAMRAADFRRLGIAETWSQALSDDLSLSRAVRRAGLKITFVPECLVASFESFTWRRLCEFARRQFLITRVYTPGAWWLGFLSSLGSVLGLWGAAAAAVHAGMTHGEHLVLWASVAGVFFLGQLTRAVLRQLAVIKPLREHLSQLLPTALADIFGGPIWSVLLLALLFSSAVGRTIRWRGIRYRLVSPTQIRVLGASGPEMRRTGV